MSTTDDQGSPRFYFGTRADLQVGDLIAPDGPAGFVHLTRTLDAAAWEAELGPGDGVGRIYEVEPTGPIADDPDVATKKFPGRAVWFRSRDPLRIIGLATDAQGRPLRFFHGTKADLLPGALIEPGHASNFEHDEDSDYVYLTGTLDAATWGAELALGDGPGRIYEVEPTGAIMDDPHLTNSRFPGNPTKSYRSREPLRVTGEITDWQGHPPEVLRAMKEGLERLKDLGPKAEGSSGGG